MLDRERILSRILQGGVVAVVRSPDPEPLVRVAEALVEGGVTAIEITFTVPDAARVIAAVRAALAGRIVLGAGTVLDPETARAALLAGAEFLVSPTVNLDTIRLARRYGVPVLPGAFTPTEVLAAWEAGADVVKIFPADIGGPAYLKTLHGPLPQVRLMPTGGVDLDTGRAFLDAGAVCLGVGSALVDQKLVASGAFGELTERAEAFSRLIRAARAAS